MHWLFLKIIMTAFGVLDSSITWLAYFKRGVLYFEQPSNPMLGVRFEGGMTHLRAVWHIWGWYDTFEGGMTHLRAVWHISYNLLQGRTNPVRQVARANIFGTVATNICGSAVWNLNNIVQMSLRILRYLKICGTLIHSVDLAHRSVLKIKTQSVGQHDWSTGAGKRVT